MFILKEGSLELAGLLSPAITLLIAGIIMIFAWKICNSIAVYLGLKLRGFREREPVVLNGRSVILTKMGWFSTTFLILEEDGTMDSKIIRWATFSNLNLESQKIERISLNLNTFDG